MLGRRGREAVWSGKEQGRGQRDGLGSATDSHHLSCQAFHHSVQLENEDQVEIAPRNPDAFHKNKQGSFPSSLVSVSLCVFMSISRSLGACVCVCVLAVLPSLCSLSSYFLCGVAPGFVFGLYCCHCL